MVFSIMLMLVVHNILQTTSSMFKQPNIRGANTKCEGNFNPPTFNFTYKLNNIQTQAITYT
jgi:hypothetical protein